MIVCKILRPNKLTEVFFINCQKLYKKAKIQGFKITELFVIETNNCYRDKKSFLSENPVYWHTVSFTSVQCHLDSMKQVGKVEIMLNSKKKSP